MRFKEKKRKVPATRGFIHATAPAMRMRTSSEAQQQAAAWPCAWRRARRRLCPDGRAPPLPNTVAVHIHPIWSFAKFARILN